ncbi:lysophosphatidylserine lipase ABHD12 isoform X2 [Gymnodraco acuticeps]|uniref:Lysophosphatidylserine lipase ABHD12 isoform X2 n=1 Tax=Gymnodraco acuticeps TaxID=8218 RepID=A0A6P8UUE0_GYMAC|nr:lysophosphatidylserine lipase ABHD12 isoform X2 [Gymnodraco acuticeps]
MTRKRVVKQHGASSAASKVQRSARVQRDEAPSRWWLKRGLLALVIFLLVPCLQKTLPELIQHLVYTHRVRVPFFIDLSRPSDLSLNHTVNMYLTSEEGISLGVWHTVPESKWKEAQGKDLAWYQDTLKDRSPVFIYLHGNTGTRAAAHRIGVAKVLSALGYHVLVPDYRGFGDSTGEPTEAGVTTDALYVYNWVKERSGDSLVVIWGHSLGTGVATNAAVKLHEQGRSFDGVILEGTFNTKGQEMPIFTWVNFWNLSLLTCEDDHLAPIQTVQELYEVAVMAQNAERVKMVPFDGSLGYLHNGLYRDPHLPDSLQKFVLSL